MGSERRTKFPEAPSTGVWPAERSNHPEKEYVHSLMGLNSHIYA